MKEPFTVHPPAVEGAGWQQQLLDRTPALMFAKDLEGRYLYVNLEFEKQFGLRSADILGKTDEEVFSAEQAASFRTNDREVLDSGKPIEFEEVAHYVDGTHISIVHKFPLKDQEDRIYGVGGIATDITQRKLAERVLRESEERFRLMIETVKDYAIFLLDREGTVISWNEGAKRINGYASDEIIGKHFSLFFPEEERKKGKPMSHLMQAESLDRFQDEGWRVRKDGSRYWADVIITALKDEKGNLHGFAKIIRDRTEQRESGLRLEQQRQMLAQAEQMAALGSWEWNITENKVIWSDELYSIYGLERKDFDGTFEGFLKYVHPDDRGPLQKSIQQALLDCQPFSYEERIIRPDGGTRILSTQGMVLLDASGRPERLFGGCLDITGMKHAEQKLKESHRQLRALAGHLQFVREEERSHISREIHDDLGQALTALKMDLSMAEEMVTSGKKVDKRGLRKEFKSMLAIVNTTIETVRSIAADLRPSILDHLGLPAAIEWYADRFQRRTGIKCEVRSFSRKVTMDKGNALSIFRIIQEALTNTARHAQATRATVVMKKSGEKITVRIADNGRGIKPEELESIRALGILGMKERATLLEGSLSVEGSPRGTVVLLEVPFKNESPGTVFSGGQHK